jgi:hypothetical protein
MWGWMANNQILKLKVSEFFKLVELAIIMVLGSVEDIVMTFLLRECYGSPKNP